MAYAARQTPPAPTAPIGEDERIESLDALRGLAIWGILFVNIQYFALPFFMAQSHAWRDLPAFDAAARLFVTLGCEFKFISLFSLLFGAGLAVQMARAERAGRGFVGLYSRRLVILLGFGLLHGFMLWYGDILSSYALLGFAALLFRRCRNLTLVIWAALLLMVPVLIVGVFAALDPSADWKVDSWAGKFGMSAPASPTATGEFTPFREIARLMDDETRIYTSGSLGEILKLRALYFVSAAGFAFPLIYLWRCLALFLVGIAAVRAGLFTPSPRQRQCLSRFLPVGLIAGIGIEGVAEYTHLQYGESAWATSIQFTCIYIGSLILALAYATAVILLVTRAGGSPTLRRLVPFGRMALTNYLTQSLLCGLIFYRPGLGLFGAASHTALLGLAVGIGLLQLVVSVWWLNHF